MIRRRIGYHDLGEGLEAELFSLCVRLRKTQADKLRPMTDAFVSEAEARRAAARCVIMKHRSEVDFPRLLEADTRVCTLLRTLQETASLLGRLRRRSGRRDPGLLS